MSEKENVEQGASGEARDYSRPVGWWCPVCGDTVAVSVGPYGVPPQRFCANVLSGSVFCFRSVIPVFLPIPEGQRPLVEDEVESAEVVTATDIGENMGGGMCVHCPVDATIQEQKGGGEILWAEEIGAFRWPDAAPVTVDDINYIAQASARHRAGIVTGATE